MLLRLMAHHTPFTPSAVDVKKSAIGILAPVSSMLMTAGIFVSQKPLNIPMVIISMHIGI